MSTNLASARQAILVELDHARQGAAYYDAKVQALENALSELDRVSNVMNVSARDNARAPAGRTVEKTLRSATARTISAPRGRVRREEPRSKDSTALPKTGTAFWLELINDQPQSAAEIAEAAVAAIGLLKDQKEQVQKLKQRAAPALASLVASKKVRDSGVGRDRRYFRTAPRDE